MTISQVSGNQHTEAKEALAAALLTRVYRELSGIGETGGVVLGEKPSKRFTTAFLMPMRDANGIENMTENLRISVHGMDIQTLRGKEGAIEVKAGYAIYVRVLPNWDDLCDRRYDMAPRFMLSNVIKSAIDAQVIQGLETAWEEAKSKPTAQRPTKRDLREQIFREVRTRMGMPEIVVSTSGEEDETTPDETEESAGLPYQVAGSDVPDDLVSSISPPQKWRRFATDPDIGVTITADATQDDFDSAAADLSERLRRSLIEQVRAWLTTEAGTAEAYRPLRVLPSNITNRSAWESFLATAMGTPPEMANLVPQGLADVRVLIARHTDFGRAEVNNVRIVLENYATAPTNHRSKFCEACIHQVSMSVSLPATLHHRLRLERIKSTYRFRHFFSYAALGINCGVEEKRKGAVVHLTTTWLPIYQQPRLEAKDIAGFKTDFSVFADPLHDLALLQLIPREFGKWVEAQLAIDPAEHLSNPTNIASERAAFNGDIAAYRREIVQIERGIGLLHASRRDWEKDATSPLAVPYRAWLYLNMTMADAWGDSAGWRLFQLTFILAHLPSIVSRMKEFEDYFDLESDEETAALLYFPTGGGKSEAFYGLLIYNLFLDRLRGKHLGITAFIRYPLRLLTIQQAQRLFKLLAKAELVKLRNSIGGDEFTIGFWVGSSNTPNTNSASELDGVQRGVGDPDPAPGAPDYEEYFQANQSYNKVPRCPHCGGVTGLRRGVDSKKKVLIVCRDGACKWNVAHAGFHPLPFLITDEDIYGFAPAVILGTIDKLALIGHHNSTINKIAGMLGLARFMDSNGRLLMPRQGHGVEEVESATPLAPAFSEGAEVFHDPFPSLLIQDEAHLLEESLGTFAGLFETSFDQLLEGLAPLLGKRIARRPDGKPRLPKVIAATATISSPERQMETLYQRRAVRFPHPGTSLYESFYSVPKAPVSAKRNNLLPDSDPRKAEIVSPIMRNYASLLTNGRVYAVATATTLSMYHSVVCRFWRKAANGDATLNAELIDALPENPLTPFWQDALISLDSDTLHSLLDLFRITLVYVNSKRGGDQVIEAIAEESVRGHRRIGEPFRQLRTELISGGVDISVIQRVMSLAQEEVVGDDLDGALREIVATSAISHGVDVDMFNAMFFVGAPTDISELIQASSRVGRTHVGFSLLLPTPNSRRDRYIVEVHDIFHRFLEQMVAPAAIERWAANAIRRVMPSIFQLWLNGVKEQELFVLAEDKTTTHALITIRSVKDLMALMGPRFMAELTAFAKKAISVQGRGGQALGRPGSADYYDSLIDQMLRDLCNSIAARPGLTDKLSDYWASSEIKLGKPMTSLRDIDEVGLIVPSVYLPGGGFSAPSDANAMQIATKVVRSQSTNSSDLDYDRESKI